MGIIFVGEGVYHGLSTDLKPTFQVPVHAQFFETDTGGFYLFDGIGWIPIGTGETNTASNIGSIPASIGFYDTKVNQDLQFRNLNAGSNRVTLTLDSGNKVVNVDVNQNNLFLEQMGGSIATRSKLPATIAYEDEANSFGDLDQQFRSGRVKIRNPSGSAQYSVVGSAITGNVNVTLPQLTVDDVFVMANFPQALGNKTITSSVINATNNTITNLADVNVAANAAIAYTKLNLANSILNGDISPAAAIVYSKLDLLGSIDNDDIAVSAGIEYQKLNLFESITDSDIDPSGLSRAKIPSAIVYDDEPNTFANENQTFRSGRVKIRDPANTHEYSLVGTNLPTNDVNVIIPALSGHDTLVFNSQAATLENKSINADQNTITNIDNNDVKANAGIIYTKLDLLNSITNADLAASANIDWNKVNKAGSMLMDIQDVELMDLMHNQHLMWDANHGKWMNMTLSQSGASMAGGGTASLPGNGSTKVFQIQHGLGQIPDVVTVIPASVDALGAYSITKDAINIYVTYQVAPPLGAAGNTNNVKFEWGTAYVGSLVIGAKSGYAAGGTFQDSGNGVNNVFGIVHNLTPQPEVAHVMPSSVDARGSFTVSINQTHIVVTYPEAPVTGVNNLVLLWGAGYVNEAPTGFTPGSVTTMFHKTIGDCLFFDMRHSHEPLLEEGHVPHEELDVGCIYYREIDDENGGFFALVMNQGERKEVQIS